MGAKVAKGALDPAAGGAGSAGEIEALYRLLAENGSDAVSQIHSDGTIQYMSPACRELTGLAPEAFIGKSFHAFVHPDDQERVRQFLQKTLVATDASRLVCRLLCADGSFRWSETTVRAARDPRTGEARMLNCASRDITDRRHLEHAILDISNREKQQFGGLLHDSVGQQLTGLVYLSRALSQRLQSSHSREAESAEELSRLTQETLADTRRLAKGLWPVNLEFSDLTTALQQMAEMTDKVFHVRCVVRLRGDIRVVDPVAALSLYYLAHEAVNNAVRHAHANEILVALEAEDGQGRLEVRDDGVGLPDDRGGGRGGMGLRLMKLRAEALGGQLMITSKPGQGTSVVCVFPTGPQGGVFDI